MISPWSVAFNVLTNGILSFAAGLLVVTTVLAALKTPPGKLKLYLLSLPFVKIVYDVARWIPADSHLWTGSDPLHQFSSRSLVAWLGLNDFGPYAGLGLRLKDAAGNAFSLSAADMLAAMIRQRSSQSVIAASVALLLVGSMVFVLRRVATIAAFEWQRRRSLARVSPRDVRTERLGRRSVVIYIDSARDGSPFSGGSVRPYICLPRPFVEKLDERELEAVTAHELAHIKSFDLLQAQIIAFLGDIFWFVPGYGALQRRIETLRELLADRDAVRRGAKPTALATALTKLVETRMPLFGACSALGRREPDVMLRARTLLERRDPSTPAPRLNSPGAAMIVAITVSAAVMMTSLGGNNELTASEPLMRYIADKIMAVLGWSVSS